ncbi:hypothetical protein ACN4EE_09595 [Geminocystis sp. CENA526]|uniref:hypothetical protein n=1 Tax=Geminocystis sp. CENA526 TaxID=1355871 RepID=UPI003D6F1BCF
MANKIALDCFVTLLRTVLVSWSSIVKASQGIKVREIASLALAMTKKRLPCNDKKIALQ